MIGEPPDFKCGFKGAECWYVLRFLTDQLELSETKPLLAQAGKYMQKLVAVWNRAGWKLTPDEVTESWAHYRGFVACTRDEEALNFPKSHQFMHMMRRLEFAGNPKIYACWTWEGLNKPLKRSCRNISQHTFEMTVLNSVNRMLRDSLRAWQ